MFKSKKNRDSALLIFMGLVTIFFLVYLFFPSLWKNEEGKKKTRGNTNITAIQNSVPGSGSKDLIINDSSDFLSGLRQKLKETQELISSSQSPFYPPKSDDIEQLFLKTYKWDKEGELEKLLKYTFRDLDRIFENKFVKNLEPAEKFDIFTALFLIRADREMIAAKSGSLSLKDIYGLSGLSSYEMIENEIQYDYQSIPVIFFSSLFISRDSLIPPSKETLKFFKKTEKIRDISDGQLLNSLKSIVLYSADQKTFSIEWKEYDPLDPDDVGKYRGIGCLVEKWIKFRYIIYPGKSNTNWIRELIKSDRGEFELEDLEISEEIPGEKRIAKTLLWSENLSMFIVILEEPMIISTNKFLDKLFTSKVENFTKKYNKIDLLNRYRDKKKFKKELLVFGKYLYKIREIFLGN